VPLKIIIKKILHLDGDEVTCPFLNSKRKKINGDVGKKKFLGLK
jgi:hypothetical protein